MNKYELDNILDMDGKGEWAIFKLKLLDNGEIEKKEIAKFQNEIEAREVFTDLTNTFIDN